MANPLAKSIMNNISKKKIDKPTEIKREDSIKNINEKEEDILKSILYKNKNRVNINSLKIEKSNNQKSKEPFSTDIIQNSSKKTSIKDLANKKIISLKDLAK